MGLIAEIIAEPVHVHIGCIPTRIHLWRFLEFADFGEKGIHRKSTLYPGVRYGEVRYSEREVYFV